MCCTTRENLLLKYSKSEKNCFISNKDTCQTTLSHRVKTGSLEAGPLAYVAFAIVHLLYSPTEPLYYLEVMEIPASENFAQRFSEAESGCHCARIHCFFFNKIAMFYCK